MLVKVSALGVLKKFVREESVFEIADEGITLKELACDLIGIPPTESGVCFIVNGRVRKQTETIFDKANVVVVKMGGAG